MSKEKTPSRGPWLIIVLLALAGIGLSAYLTYIHIGVHTNPDFNTSCDINQKVSCSQVALSSYAITAGLPTSVWGLIGYFFVLLIGLLGWRRRGTKASALHGMLLVLTACCFAAGVFFAYVSFTQIKALCLYCMGTYAINILVFVVAFFALRGDHVGAGAAFGALLQWLPRHVMYLLAPGFLVVVIFLGYPKYWDSVWQGVKLPKSVCSFSVSDSEIPHGTDKEGHHWIGAKDPRVTIVEFADYECPYCKKAHFELRALLRMCPKVVRLYHRHYPLDHSCNPRINRPFHKNACLLARAAYCAGKQGKFWAANDYLYKEGKKTAPARLVEEMTKLGLNGDKLQACLQSKEASDAIAQDMTDGRGHKMQGTPFFLMNNVPYHKGFIPKEAIVKALEQVQTAPPTHPRSTPASTREQTPTQPRSREAQPDAGRTKPPATPKPPTFRPLTPPDPTAPAPRR